MYNKVLINFPGGFVPTAHLRLLATVILHSNSEEGFLTKRQQFVIPKIKSNNTFLKQLSNYYPIDIVGKETPNIVCSNYVGGIGNCKNDWAYNQDIYLEVLQSFKSLPTLSMGFVNPYQPIEPIFSSHINFLVSQIKNYWLLALQKNKEKIFAPFLLETSMIKKSVEIIEKNWHSSLKNIIHLIYNEFQGKVCSFKEFKIPYMQRDILEGFHKMNDFELLLNIYSCSKAWQGEFLEQLGVLMTKYNLQRAYITSRKSFLIKHIPKDSLNEWQSLLASHYITTRHSEQEFLWDFPQYDKKLEKLKNRLVKNLNKKQQSLNNTFIRLKNSDDMDTFTDAHMTVTLNKKRIEKSYQLSYFNNLDYRSNELYTLNNLSFDSLCKSIVNIYRKNIYNSKIKEDKIIQNQEASLAQNNYLIYECPKCLSRYDEYFEFSEKQNSNFISFQDLPNSWKCQLCGNPKECFKKIANYG